MLGDAPAKDFKAYTLTRPFSLHVLRQTVSRNMGYEVCQEVPLQSVNKGVLKLQRAVKKERIRASHLLRTQFRSSNVWFVGYRRGPTRFNMLAIVSPTSLCTLSPHKNPKLSFWKVLDIKHSRCTFMHTLYNSLEQRCRGILLWCVLTFTSCISRQPHKRPCMYLTIHAHSSSSLLLVFGRNRE